MTGFGWGSAILVSSGPATFAHPYTGRRDCEQIGTFEKMWEVSESGGRSFDVLAGNLSSPGICPRRESVLAGNPRGDPTVLIETWGAGQDHCTRKSFSRK